MKIYYRGINFQLPLFPPQLGYDDPWHLETDNKKQPCTPIHLYFLTSEKSS